MNSLVSRTLECVVIGCGGLSVCKSISLRASGPISALSSFTWSTCRGSLLTFCSGGELSAWFFPSCLALRFAAPMVGYPISVTKFWQRSCGRLVRIGSDLVYGRITLARVSSLCILYFTNSMDKWRFKAPFEFSSRPFSIITSLN